MIDIEKIEAAYQKATAGEWYLLGPPWLQSGMATMMLAGTDDPHGATTVCDFAFPEDGDKTDNTWNDAESIALLHNAWPQIRRELAEKDAEIETLKEIAKEYSQLCRHMDAGGDFFEFQAARGQK